MRSARLVSGPNSEWSPWAHRASATAAFQPGPDWTGSDSSSGGASGAGQSWMLEKCQPEPARPGQGLRHGRGVREGQEGQEGFRPGCRAERQVQTGDARAPLAGGEARGAGTRAALPFSDGGTCLPSLRLTACPPASQSRQPRRTDGELHRAAELSAQRPQHVGAPGGGAPGGEGTTGPGDGRRPVCILVCGAGIRAVLALSCPSLP